MDKVFSNFDIHLLGLELKEHVFNFEGSSSFFEIFEQSLIHDGRFSVELKLTKTSNMLRLVFKIDTTIKLECDRSLELFEERYQFEEQFIYKFGDRHEEISDELSVIPFGTVKINVANLIYEYIYLKVPMRKIHPKYHQEAENDQNELMHKDLNNEEAEPKEKGDFDQRWSALKGLKDREE